jgi:hypothetical protein
MSPLQRNGSRARPDEYPPSGRSQRVYGIGDNEPDIDKVYQSVCCSVSSEMQRAHDHGCVHETVGTLAGLALVGASGRPIAVHGTLPVILKHPKSRWTHACTNAST